MIRFEFEPKDKQLTPEYIKLEKAINEMNKAGNINAVNHWALEAHKAVCNLWEMNCHAIDIMGGGLS